MKSLITILLLVVLVACNQHAVEPESYNLKSTTSSAATLAITINNPGFETGGASQNPSGWSTLGTNASADYSQKGGHSGSYSLAHWRTAAYQVYTYQTLSGLTNGYYSLSAWVQNGGGQNACYLTAKDFGDGEKMTSLPVAGSWTQVIIRGINVTNGTCTVGLYSDAKGGNWCKLDDIQFVKDDKAYTFLKGGDVSELSYLESKGAKFYDGGAQKDCMQILKDKGFNIVRLRLYNDPGNPNYSPSKRLPTGFQNPTDILALAKRAKDKGLQIQLTFHYSDYWTNGPSQPKPHDWVGLSYTDLKTAVYNFTYNFMNQMKAQGTTPEYVSLGNETARGILFPDGSTSNFAQLAELFNQGYNAVKAVSSNTKVIIHLDGGGNTGKYDAFFGQCATYGVMYDIIGASYYPFWTGRTVSQIRSWANYITNKYDKDIIIMETGFDWNPTLPNGYPGQLADSGPYDSIYASSPTGQRDFLYECFNGLKLADNGRVIGDLYWDPVMIAVPGVGWELGGENVVANSTLFDFTGNALPAFQAYMYNN